MKVILAKRTIPQVFKGKEGLLIKADGSISHDDYWLHEDVMSLGPDTPTITSESNGGADSSTVDDLMIKGGLWLNEPKPRRKSVNRIDKTPTDKNKVDDSIEKLGLQNLVAELTTKTVVRKSKAENIDLILDLEKAIDVEHIARKVHEEWMKTAPDSHPNKIPYDQLTEKQKDKDRNTVNTVLRSADLIKADNSHLPSGAERYAYIPTTNYNVVYIPVNRLKQVYQTDEALNPKKVSENRKKMKAGIPLDPVEIGYNYDTHDGHHRWEAAKQEGHTHVPCKVVGTDPIKVKEAIANYKKVWKSSNDIFMILDLSKGFLNTAKLVKKRVAVRGKMGKIFYRMQWVDPNDKNPAFEHTGKPDETTYHHHEEGIKDMEKRQSNKFPVVHHPVSGIKNTERNYNTDRDKYNEAHSDYTKGKALPPVKINDKGEILEHHHLVDLAKKLGLTHVPVTVMGNTELKKKLEERLKERDQVAEVNEDGERVVSPLGHAPTAGTSHSPNVDTFKNFTSKKYTKQHIMNEARKHGIEWKEDLTSNHSDITWMRAYQAIVAYLNAGGILEISHDEKEVDKRMKQDGWDSIHKHFMKLREKHGSKQSLMEWATDNGITWKYNDDPNINWMRAAEQIKKELAKGKMVDGVRTRQKDAMDEANLVITDQIKEMVATMTKKHGQFAMMDKAKLLGIYWNPNTGKGGPLHRSITWMRASQAISRYLAQGNTFTIGEDNPEDNKITAKVKDYGGVKLSNLQGVAVDLGKRNSQNFELKAKEWALKAFKADYENADNAEEMYQKFMDNAKNARLMMHFDPSEMLPSGVSLLEQMSSDGTMRNRWEMGSVPDGEAQQLVERELYGYDFDEAKHSERPTFGVVDLLNQGIKASPYGSVALVLKDDVKKRSTGTYTDSANLDYETNGGLTRSLTDPHHLLVDRWTTKWKSPKNSDAKRKRMMDSVMNNIRCRDDGDYFESQVIGGVNLRSDVDHILVPAHWQGDKTHKEKHDNIKALSKLMGFDIKYE